MKALVDTNVALDVALLRPPHYEHSARVLECARLPGFHLFITASSFTDLCYVLTRHCGVQAAKNFLNDLVGAVDVCPVDKPMILSALRSDFRDPEDAVQHFAAEAFGAEVIVTRNKADFAASTLEVLDPKEFCEKYLHANESHCD